MARILLVDDDDVVLQSLAACLEHAGHDVWSERSGRGVTDLCRQREVDVVLLELVIPAPDGMEVIAFLRSETPGVRIIAMSGSGECDLYLRMASRLGADRTLVKPFRMADMLEAIDSLFVPTKHAHEEQGHSGRGPIKDLKAAPWSGRGWHARRSS